MEQDRVLRNDERRRAGQIGRIAYLDGLPARRVKEMDLLNHARRRINKSHKPLDNISQLHTVRTAITEECHGKAL